MRWRLIAVVGIILLAGCNGLPFSGDQPESTTETLTPVPIDTPSPPSAVDTRADLPPGVFANGTVDVTKLRRAHAEEVTDRSYTWTFVDNRTYPGENNSYWLTRQVRVGENVSLVSTTEKNGSTELTFVSNESAYRRTGSSDDGAVTRFDSPRDEREYVLTGEILSRFLGKFPVDVSLVERDGRRFYRLFAAPDSQPITLSNRSLDAVWNYRVTAYVTPDGFVKSMTVEYQHRSTAWRQHVSFRFDYTSVGSTDVPRPEWASESAETTVSTAVGTEATGDVGSTRRATPSTNTTVLPSKTRVPIPRVS